MILTLAYYLSNQILEGQIISPVAPSSVSMSSKSWLFLFIAKLLFSKRSRLVDVLWGQPIKLIQVVSTSEFHEY